MTTLTERPATALLVIDAQLGVLDGACNREAVIGNLGSLVDRARVQDVPVVWVQHTSGELPEGSPQWQMVSELVPDDAEPVVHKRFGDAFEGTDLETVLALRGVGRLVVGGAQTDACVRSTIHGAFGRGYDVTLVQDAHTTEDLTAYGAPPPQAVIDHTNLYWSFQSAPGRTAGTVATDAVDFAPGGSDSPPD